MYIGQLSGEQMKAIEEKGYLPVREGYGAGIVSGKSVAVVKDLLLTMADKPTANGNVYPKEVLSKSIDKHIEEHGGIKVRSDEELMTCFCGCGQNPCMEDIS